MSLPIESFSHVALLTRDLPEAVAFYRDFLGLAVVYQTERSAMLRVGGKQAPGCGIVLFEPEQEGTAPPGDGGPLHHLGLSVAGRQEVDRCAHKAREAGYRVEGPLEDDYIGYFCLVWDADGNRIEFAAPEGVNRF